MTWGNSSDVIYFNVLSIVLDVPIEQYVRSFAQVELTVGNYDVYMIVIGN